MFENEKIIENKICKHCKSSFEITDKDLEFYEKISPSFGGKKYLIPTPTLCPDCRQQRRLSFRNFMSLHKRKCSATGEEIVSMYGDKSNFPVYNLDLWWSDNWSGFDYGIDFDFELSALDQIKRLHNSVPKANLLNIKGENVYYCNGTFNSQSSYLIFGGVDIENCIYGHIVWYSKRCISNLYIYKCEMCYECVDCFECYKVFFENCGKNALTQDIYIDVIIVNIVIDVFE